MELLRLYGFVTIETRGDSVKPRVAFFEEVAMSSKMCLECGTPLTAWNHNFGSPRCTDCVRVPLVHSKAFFEKTHPAEKDILDYPVAGFMGKMVGYAAILLVVITLAAIIGYENARSFGGLAYGFISGLVVIAAFRWHTGKSSIHPLDTKRWYHFAILYSLLVVLVWTFAYMGFMPTVGLPIGGSLFSFHVRITPSFLMSAFWMVTLISVGVGLLGLLLGYFNILRSDKKDKAVTLIHFQLWKQANP